MAGTTIQEISAVAGVSIATVSRVLNRKGNVSSSTADKVFRAAQQLGYEGIALSPRTQIAKHQLIAVILPSLKNPFYNDILSGIQSVAAKSEYGVIVVQLNSHDGTGAKLPTYVNAGLVDGIITLMHKDQLQGFFSMVNFSAPTVQCCEFDETLPYPYVGIDNFKAAFNAVSYLISTNRKRIAMFNSTCDSLYGSEREQGFRKALEEHGIPIREDWIHHLNVVDYKIAYSAAMAQLKNKEDIPDAIFCISDLYAAAVIRAARRRGLRVPEDLAVVGFDNTEISLMADPSITTVNQSRFEIGSIACTTLMRLINKQPLVSHKSIVSTELIVREST